MSTFVEVGDREIKSVRVYEAPRPLVFRMWTEREHIEKWWGPNGFTTTTYEMDVRPGGTWRFTMHGPDGADYPNRIVYREVVIPERLVYSHGDDASIHFEVSVTFAEEEEKTRISMQMTFATAEEKDRVVRNYGAVEGNRQTLQRLADHLKTMATTH